MTIEQAIKTAIAFEKKVHATYQAATERATDATAKKVFATLAEEELGHIGYLESRLEEWQRKGFMAPEKLKTVLPSTDRIRRGVARMQTQMASREGGESPELDSLRQALAAEEETSSFYRKMVLELPAEGQELFNRFIEIEDGHSALVQAEIDSVSKMGFWFDLREFELEAG